MCAKCHKQHHGCSIIRLLISGFSMAQESIDDRLSMAALFRQINYLFYQYSYDIPDEDKDLTSVFARMRLVSAAAGMA